MKRKIVSENHVKALVKDWFDSVRAWSYAPVQTGMGVHGIPDRIGCVPVKITPDLVGATLGLFVAVECKKPGRRGELARGMSKHQAHVLLGIGAASGVARVCDGEEDLGELHAFIFQEKLPGV